MSYATVITRAGIGIDAPLVRAEVHLSGGLPRITLVGLPETAVRESRERVRSAIINAHFEFPQSRLTVNLAPADLPKEGGRFDLAIALGVLAASGQLDPRHLEGFEFLGELALDGELRPVTGCLPAALACRQAGRTLVVPGAEENFRRRALDFMRAEARRRITAHIAPHAAALGVAHGPIRVKDTRSRWGSCAPDGTLAFSWRLVMAPEWVMDYVVAHEVAHLKELNHSPRFWAHLAKLTPHREEAVAWLTKEGPALLRIG